MMNAVAPEGTPPRRINNGRCAETVFAPLCLGEALRRGILPILQQLQKNEIGKGDHCAWGVKEV